jgi:sugar phosphate permease
MVSYYFDKNNGMALSAWNGSSQLGDLISLMTYYLIVISKQWPTYSSFFLIAFYILICGIAVKFVIPNLLKKE